MSVLYAFSAFLLPAPFPALPQAEAIVPVICFNHKNIYSGTAFRIGPTGEMLSVNHVTSSGQCFIGKQQLDGRVWKSPKADFSMVDYGVAGPYIPIDCGGFKKGHKYLAIGYAQGAAKPTIVELLGTGEHDKDGQAILLGIFTSQPGMSGGPVIDEETGKAVGTNDAASFERGASYSAELKDEPICSAIQT